MSGFVDYAVLGLLVVTVIANGFTVWSLHRASRMRHGCERVDVIVADDGSLRARYASAEQGEQR